MWHHQLCWGLLGILVAGAVSFLLYIVITARVRKTPVASARLVPELPPEEPVLGSGITAVYYINLDHRTDRLPIIQGSMKELRETRAVRFSAVRESPGFMGCTKSHIGVLEAYLRLPPTPGWLGVFEDDWWCGPLTTEQRVHWKGLLAGLMDRDECQVILLALNPLSVTPEQPGIVQVHRALSTSGYLVRHDYVSVLLENFRSALARRRPLDVHWWELQNRGWYGLQPPLGVQHESFSDIENCPVNYRV